MKTQYDFPRATKNPYARRLKQQITLRVDPSTVSYFKALAEETGLPYQNLINLFLRECAQQKRKPTMRWG